MDGRHTINYSIRLSQCHIGCIILEIRVIESWSINQYNIFSTKIIVMKDFDDISYFSQSVRRIIDINKTSQFLYVYFFHNFNTIF